MSQITNGRAGAIGTALVVTAWFAFAATPEPQDATSDEPIEVVVDGDAPTAALEAPAALELAQRLVPEIEQLLFERRPRTERPIRIVLHGNFFGGNPPRARVPHVDYAGVVHLYKYGPTHLSAMAHELTHAILRRAGVRYGGFDEEGIAAWAAHVVDPAETGFPTYGQHADTVAGHWLVSDLRIPLTLVRAEFRALNLRCSFQVYSLRKSFFLNLGDRYGVEAMRKLLGVMGARDAYQTVFKTRLAELERDWLASVTAHYESLPNRAELRSAYRSLPALDDLNACAPGRDFESDRGAPIFNAKALSAS